MINTKFFYWINVAAISTSIVCNFVDATTRHAMRTKFLLQKWLANEKYNFCIYLAKQLSLRSLILSLSPNLHRWLNSPVSNFVRFLHLYDVFSCVAAKFYLRHSCISLANIYKWLDHLWERSERNHSDSLLNGVLKFLASKLRLLSWEFIFRLGDLNHILKYAFKSEFSSRTSVWHSGQCECGEWRRYRTN